MQLYIFILLFVILFLIFFFFIIFFFFLPLIHQLLLWIWVIHLTIMINLHQPMDLYEGVLYDSLLKLGEYGRFMVIDLREEVIDPLRSMWYNSIVLRHDELYIIIVLAILNNILLVHLFSLTLCPLLMRVLV